MLLSSEWAVLVGLPSGPLDSCSLGILERAFISWSLSKHNSLEVTAGAMVGGGRKGCADGNVARWEKGWPSRFEYPLSSVIIPRVVLWGFFETDNFQGGERQNNAREKPGGRNVP